MNPNPTITLFGLSTDKFNDLMLASAHCRGIHFTAVIMIGNETIANVHSYDDYNRFIIEDLHKWNFACVHICSKQRYKKI